MRTHAGRSTLRACWLLFVWQVLRFKRFLPMLIVIQVAIALGIVYGLAFLIPDIDRRSAMYLATGAPTLSLLILGLTVVPQEVSQGKLSGRFEYLRSLPVPRLATLVVDVAFWLLAQLPGTALAIVVASIRFDFPLEIGWTVVVAVLLVAFTAACVGYAISMLLEPQVSNQLSSFISIGLLLFSPINFPVDRLPSAVEAIHRVLPVMYMADLVRHGLVGMGTEPLTLSFAVVGAWCAAGLLGSYRAATKRH